MSSTPKTYYAFTCGKLKALTDDQTGGKLPKALCPAGWKFWKTVKIGPNEKSRIGLDVQKALIDIETHGYHIVEIKVAVTEKLVPPPSVPVKKRRASAAVVSSSRRASGRKRTPK